MAKHINLNNDAVRAIAAAAVLALVDERLPIDARRAKKELAETLAKAKRLHQTLNDGLAFITMDVNDVFRTLPEAQRQNLSNGKKQAFEAAAYQAVAAFNKDLEGMGKLIARFEERLKTAPPT